MIHAYINDCKVTLGLTNHQQSVHEGKKHPCGTCDYQATTRGSLTTHQQAEHERTKYECNLCSSQFTRKSSLSKHEHSVHSKFSL